MSAYTRDTFPKKGSFQAPATRQIRPASGNPSNVQTFRLDYQYGIYVIISIDINNYFNTIQNGLPPFPGDYPWLIDWKLYQNSTLLYVFSDLAGIVLESMSGTHPFNDPNNLIAYPGVAFWTYDNNVYASFYDVMTIESLGYYDMVVSSVTYAYPCFKEGSKILTEKGYRPVEELRKGDKVMTYYHGFKTIDMIGRREIHHPANIEERMKEQLYKCSPSAYPELTEDLVLTGAHSILVTAFKDEAEKERAIKVNGDLYVTDGKGRLPACADERATVYETAGTYMIYHFALEHDDYYMNYGVYANGLLVETCSKRYMKELSNMTLIE
jgi:Hint domain